MDSDNPYQSPRTTTKAIEPNPLLGFLLSAIFGTLTGMALVGIVAFVVWMILEISW